MGLFDKKYCDVCGDKIGLLGNRKLEDGNLCKNCAAKLSPWFTERRHSGLNDIKSQLEDRESNKGRVAAFQPGKKLGRGYQLLYIDSQHGTFTVCTESDLKSGNPDILSLSCITDIVNKEDEHRTERKYKDSEGKMVSYKPAQYDYSYDFYCTISVNHPYIDDIRFRLNGNTVKEGAGIMGASLQHQVREYQQLGDEIKASLIGRGPAAAPAATVAAGPAIAQAQLPETSFSVHYTEPAIGIDMYVTLITGGFVAYQVTNAPQFASLNSDMLGDMLNSVVKNTFFKLDAEGFNGEKLLTDTATVQARLLQELNSSLGGMLGIQFVNSVLTWHISDQDRELLKKYRMMAAVAADPNLAAAAAVAQTNAAMKAASEDWECPACTAKNHGGKFCEYCGTPRP